MEREAFEKLIVEGFTLLPEHIRYKVKNVAILVEDEPSKELRKLERLGSGETLLGHYHGIPLSERGSYYGIGDATLPDTITLFQEPIEDEAYRLTSTESVSDYHDAVKKVVADTVWHEVAHHFGMDEPEVRRREAERE